MIAQYF